MERQSPNVMVCEEIVGVNFKVSRPGSKDVPVPCQRTDNVSMCVNHPSTRHMFDISCMKFVIRGYKGNVGSIRHP